MKETSTTQIMLLHNFINSQAMTWSYNYKQVNVIFKLNLTFISWQSQNEYQVQGKEFSSWSVVISKEVDSTVKSFMHHVSTDVLIYLMLPKSKVKLCFASKTFWVLFKACCCSESLGLWHSNKVLTSWMFLSGAWQLWLNPHQPVATAQVLSSRKLEECSVLWGAVKISLVFTIQIHVLTA